MNYYFDKTIEGRSFEMVKEDLTLALKENGFGVITEIDVKQTLKEKIDVDFRKYVILGACNPHLAYEALKAEEKIGVFLPCNVVLEERADGKIGVTVVDPIASMQAVANEALEGFGTEVQKKLKAVLEVV